MRRRWLGGAAALLVLGLAVSARAADDGAAPSAGDHWWDKINPFASKKKTDDVPKIPPTVPLPASVGAPAAARSITPPVNLVAVNRENAEDACLRRTDICDKLMQIAVDTNNKELEHKVEALQKRVNDVYRLQISSHGTRFSSDESVLDQHLGSSHRDLTPTDRATTDGRTATLREDRE